MGKSISSRVEDKFKYYVLKIIIVLLDQIVCLAKNYNSLKSYVTCVLDKNRK